jgi:hypothetical protein
MPQVEFEPTNPVSERVKTVHALDRGTTVIGSYKNTCIYLIVYQIDLAP